MDLVNTVRNALLCGTLLMGLPAFAQSEDEKAEKKKPAVKTLSKPVVKVPVHTSPAKAGKTPTLSVRPPVIGAPLPQGVGGSGTPDNKPVQNAPVIGAPLPQGVGGSSAQEKKPAQSTPIIGAPLAPGVGGSSAGDKKPVQNAPIIGAPGPATSSSTFESKPVEASVSRGGRETYTLSNGQQVPRTGPDGRAGVPDNKGGVAYKGGTYITTDESGNTVVSQGGKVQSVTPPPGSGTGGAIPGRSSTGELTYTLSNGQQIPRFGPEGSGVGVADNKGGVAYGDGTYVMVNEKGDTVVSRNGEVVSTTPAPDSGDSGDDSSSDSSSNADDDSSDSDDTSSDDDSSSDDKDTGSDDTDGAEAGDGGKDDGSKDGADKFGVGAGANSGPGKIVTDIVNRRMGIGREPESSGPEDCTEQNGGTVMDPWGAGQSNCVPAGTPRPGDGNDDDRGTAGAIWQAPSKGSIRGAVTQPGLNNPTLGRDHGKAPLEVLELFEDSVTNPAPN